MRPGILSGFMLASILGWCGLATALPPLGELKLPTDPAAWVNSVPLSASSLEGKGVLLYFYEETCPTCRGKWPAILATAKQYDGKPVVMIGVNSGTTRKDVEAYSRSTGVKWPIIVDTDRSLEKQCEVGEISLQNIYQLRIASPKGLVSQGNPADFDGSIKLALQGAAWKVDPAEMPAEFLPLWQSVEMGQYAKAASGIQRGLKSSKADTKQAAEKLEAYVQTQIDRELEDANAKKTAGEAWHAYQIFNQVVEQFAGYSLPTEIATQKEELAKDEKVAAEIKAAKTLDDAKKLASKGGTNRAVTMLKKLIEDQPDTEAAGKARELLAQVGSQ